MCLILKNLRKVLTVAGTPEGTKCTLCLRMARQCPANRARNLARHPPLSLRESQESHLVGMAQPDFFTLTIWRFWRRLLWQSVCR